MKLQYLGDSKDAFKWDLLHWLVTRAEPRFSKLVFVPLLTPDDEHPKHGRTPPSQFPARPAIADFVGGLRGHSEGLTAVCRLGRLAGEPPFEVSIHAPTVRVPARASRPSYWRELDAGTCSNALVFLDPDNGFETRTQHGAKWVLHAEVSRLLAGLPASSAIAVYQHRPRLQWNDFFDTLTRRLDCAAHISEVHEANLAFVLLASRPEAGRRVASAADAYARTSRSVEYSVLRGEVP